jgi:hypothetical protein
MSEDLPLRSYFGSSQDVRQKRGGFNQEMARNVVVSTETDDALAPVTPASAVAGTAGASSAAVPPAAGEEEEEEEDLEWDALTSYVDNSGRFRLHCSDRARTMHVTQTFEETTLVAGSNQAYSVKTVLSIDQHSADNGIIKRCGEVTYENITDVLVEKGKVESRNTIVMSGHAGKGGRAVGKGGAKSNGPY